MKTTSDVEKILAALVSFFAASYAAAADADPVRWHTMTTPTPDTVEQAAREFCDQFADELLIDKGTEALTALLLQREEAARREAQAKLVEFTIRRGEDIAASFREGWKAGAEAGAKVADRHAECWFEDRQHNRADDADQIAADIRALPEMKKE